jgi:hypothetical protein
MSGRHKLRRKPSKITLAMAGTTVLASVAVGMSVAPDVSAGQVMSQWLADSSQPSGAGQVSGRAATAATDSGLDVGIPTTEAARQKIAALGAARYAAQRAAARRATARRAAARRAAARAAATPPPAAPPPPAQPSGSAQHIAMSMLASFGWSSSQFGCLDSLWNAESGWNVYASNPASGAYGIPQALPGSKMASAGPDWQSNAATQIRWGLGYIRDLYGSPCAAWSHEQATGSY